MSRFLVPLVAILWIPVASASQTDTPVSSLIADPATFDQKIVRITGEIVGDYGFRDDVVWVQVNDDAYVERPLARRTRPAGGNTGVAVRYARSFQGDFGPPGGYGVRGPIVQVTGVFRHLDPTFGGVTFVEATDVVLAARAVDVAPAPVDRTAAIVGSVMAVLGGWELVRRRDLLPRLRR